MSPKHITIGTVWIAFIAVSVVMASHSAHDKATTAFAVAIITLGSGGLVAILETIHRINDRRNNRR